MYAVNYFSISLSNLLIFPQPFLLPHLSLFFFFSSKSFHFTPNTALDDVITASSWQRQQPHPIPVLFKHSTGLDTVAYSFPFNTFFLFFNLFFPSPPASRTGSPFISLVPPLSPLLLLPRQASKCHNNSGSALDSPLSVSSLRFAVSEFDSHIFLSD